MKDSFLKILQLEGTKPYFENIIKVLKKAEEDNEVIFPHQTNLFKPFEYFQTYETKLIILGQDPYPGINIADGLAFSTGHIKTPASLKNIFIELKKDYPNVKIGTNSLLGWAKQKILLLNSVFTVVMNQPNSHRKIGWEEFVKSIIIEIIKANENVLILTLGNQANYVLNQVLKVAKLDPKTSLNYLIHRH
ncbi:uracil-DNA glycosylase [Mycoplasmopsis cynos]|nr:uracil-DNA glycosylase [Mycoplasmopsis cynos]